MVAGELNWLVILGAAAIDSINPCAFGVLIFLLAYLGKNFKKPNMMLLHGITYIVAVYITYLLAGLLLIPIIGSLGQASVGLYWVIGIAVILAGFIEIKDFLGIGGFSLSIAPDDAERIEMYIKRISSKLSTSFFLGVFVALVELPCTGAVYLAVLALMALSGVTVSNTVMLLVYNFIFVFPLFLILGAVYYGVKAHKFQKWHKKYKKWMRLLTGIVLIIMGVWMIATVAYLR